MNIGDKIKTVRKAQKITQKELAKSVGKSERMIQKYESGEVVPPFDVVIEIANALHIPAIKLISESAIGETLFMMKVDHDSIRQAADALGVTFEQMEAIIYQILDRKKNDASTMLEEMKPVEEILNNDVGYILAVKERAYYNLHPLTQEERQRVLDMLKLLFPQYAEGKG